MPPDLEEAVWQQVQEIEEEQRMANLTFGEALLPDFRKITDLQVLQAIMARLETAATADDVWALYESRV